MRYQESGIQDSGIQDSALPSTSRALSGKSGKSQRPSFPGRAGTFRITFYVFRITSYVLLITLLPTLAFSETGHDGHQDHSNLPKLHKSITDSTILMPSREDVIRLITLEDYNTRVVIVGTMLLGLAAGVIGTFMLLRKRSLMGDAVSHATLPGITIAFIVMVRMGGNGKSLPGLLLGALLAGMVGMLVVLMIRYTTRLKEDAALGIVLSVFFGLGIAFLGVIQKMPDGSAAGLERFIYGQTASMLKSDAELFALSAAVVTAVAVLLFKEFAVLCFDQEYAGSQGWPIILLDTIMMALVVAVTVIGLQAVGMILVIALLIIPSAAARFWTEHLLRMIIGAALIGAVSGLVGACLSALFARMPAGAIIVLVARLIFGFSMCFGTARGILFRLLEHLRLEDTVARQHLMREMYEMQERAGGEDPGSGISFDNLLRTRSWTPRRLSRLLRTTRRDGLVYCNSGQEWHLSDEGLTEARRVVRNHRLWEIYLVNHADIAPSHVDRDADQIEHVLGYRMVQQLEDLLSEDYPSLSVPMSLHSLEKNGGRA
ncbi:MAG: iron chelate uptake ABC transporter family permease subunit [Planctomycetota bacterium]|nr:iron chelate uptake ABC transporter family permease subunit [Planctomycetota bacterium]